MSSDVTPNRLSAELVVYGCVSYVAGREEPFDPERTLSGYGLGDEGQVTELIDAIAHKGLPNFGYTIDARELVDVRGHWTISELVDVLVDRSARDTRWMAPVGNHGKGGKRDWRGRFGPNPAGPKRP